MAHTYYVYIMTNAHHTTLYVGVTNDLQRRVYEHKNKLVEGFTKKYNIVKLVHYEATENVQSAIAGERQLKGGSRKRKIDLIESNNPAWRDLADQF
jgi:putative endonuclease